MKKLLTIFIICTVSLLSITLCYSDLQANTFAAMEDLPLAQKFEPVESLKAIESNNQILQAVLAGQINSINSLNLIYYTGAYISGFDAMQIYNSLNVEPFYTENIPLFSSDAYKGYYDLRTSKILKEYHSSESFDYQSFIKDGKVAFDNYIKIQAKNQSFMDQLILQLQRKLTDKLPELEPGKRKVMLEEVLSLRQTGNNQKALEHLYQVFESRVRLQLLAQLVDLNKLKLQDLTEKISLAITSTEKGQLLLKNKNPQSKEESIEILNVLEGEEGYRGLIKLKELYRRQELFLVFSKEGIISEIGLDKALQAISLDEDGYLNLDLDGLNNDEVLTQAKPTAVVGNSSKENKLKVIEQQYTSKSKEAQAIVKELNRFDIYIELKTKKISNYYTRDFELKQKTWKKDLESKLNIFGPGGMADFMAYIKQFELLDRNISKQAKDKALIAKFRNSDLQFKTTEEGSKWMLNMLFKLRYMP